MYIVSYENECWGHGDTIESALMDFEKQFDRAGYSYTLEESDYIFYEAKEIKVQRKFEIVKE